jgi:hypothetical protein
MGLREFLLALFQQNSRVHIRIEPIQEAKDIVDLIDRFVFGQLRYPLEWDDFISWKNDNAQAEQVRQHLLKVEHLLFSRDRAQIDEYANTAISERNRIALLIGIQPRRRT